MEELIHDEVFTVKLLMKGERPCIIVSTNRTYYDYFLKHGLESRGRDLNDSVRSYLGKGSHFQLDREDRFGFGRCGQLHKSGDMVNLHIELRGGQYLRRTTATLNVVLSTLSSIRLLDTIWVGTKRKQLLEPCISCSDEPQGHGVYGSMYPLMSEWCAEIALHPRGEGVKQNVEQTMKCVARSLFGSREADDSITSGFFKDGRPGLSASGIGGIHSTVDNADWNFREREPQEINTANCDSPVYGLILLAGWIRLAEMAHSDIYG